MLAPSSQFSQFSNKGCAFECQDAIDEVLHAQLTYLSGMLLPFAVQVNAAWHMRASVKI